MDTSLSSDFAFDDGIEMYLQRYMDLETALEARADAMASWEAFRKVFAMYLKYRTRVDKAAPFNPAEAKDAGVRFMTRFSPSVNVVDEKEEQEGCSGGSDDGGEATASSGAVEHAGGSAGGPSLSAAAAGGAVPPKGGSSRVCSLRRPKLNVRPPPPSSAAGLKAYDEEDSEG